MPSEVLFKQETEPKAISNKVDEPKSKEPFNYVQVQELIDKIKIQEPLIQQLEIKEPLIEEPVIKQTESFEISFQPKIINVALTETKKDSRKESPKYQLRPKNVKSFVLFSEDTKGVPEPNEDDDLLQQMLGLNNKPLNSTQSLAKEPTLPTLNLKIDDIQKDNKPKSSRRGGTHQRIFSAMDTKPGMKRIDSKKEMSLDKSQWNYIEQLQKVKKLKSESKNPQPVPVKERKKARSPVSVNNFSAPPSFANFSCVGQDYHKQQQTRLINEWKEMCKVIDGVANGQNLKTRHHFSRTDLISVVQQYKKKMHEYE